MRLLCDHHVVTKYCEAFEATDWITYERIATVLSPDADDGDIAQYAVDHGYIVFTNDDDFQAETLDYDLITYEQIENPTPGDVLERLCLIARWRRIRSSE
jgi:predicted nuclease of predicted toxin-antitoxin system